MIWSEHQQSSKLKIHSELQIAEDLRAYRGLFPFLSISWDMLESTRWPQNPFSMCWDWRSNEWRLEVVEEIYLSIGAKRARTMVFSRMGDDIWLIITTHQHAIFQIALHLRAVTISSLMKTKQFQLDSTLRFEMCSLGIHFQGSHPS
jgi:hypothetical protein